MRYIDMTTDEFIQGQYKEDIKNQIWIVVHLF